VRGKTLSSSGYGPARAALAAMAMLVSTAAIAAEPRPNYGTPPTQAEFEATAKAAAARTPAATQSQCNGTFSDGTSINVAQPAFLEEVPGSQLFCDFHTFAWNQFIYLTSMQSDPNNDNTITPLFLHLAPWYNLLKPNGKAPPKAYPGGPTALNAGFLDQGQAGTDDQLVDVTGKTVLYDIRFDLVMYNAIATGPPALYNEALFAKNCNPGSDSSCGNPLWLPPTTVAPPTQPVPGSLEVKSSWRDFGKAAKCNPNIFYCDGRFGLAGLHIVQKTQTHGEWIWATFEHVANDPDCYPYGDTPIAANSPISNVPWSFFNPTTAGQGILASQICEVTGAKPQCNANPKVQGSGGVPTYVAVNICRTLYLPPGGASAANCTVVPDGPPQQSSNSLGNVACLNATFQPQMHGPWQNYKLVGSLWLKGEVAPTQPFAVQIFQQQVNNQPYLEAVGFPNLANTTMETWLQPGSTGYDPFGTNATQAGCFLCHNLPSSFSAAQNFGTDDMSHYPGKLPQSKQEMFRKALVPAFPTAAPHQ
jgi:hypothetical protein